MKSVTNHLEICWYVDLHAPSIESLYYFGVDRK